MSVKEAEEMYDAAEKAGVVFEVHKTAAGTTIISPSKTS